MFWRYFWVKKVDNTQYYVHLGCLQMIMICFLEEINSGFYSILYWKAASNACQTQHKLQGEVFPCAVDAIFAIQRRKQDDYLFLHCRFSRQCCELLFSIMGISFVLTEKISSLLEVRESQKVKKGLKSIQRDIPNSIMWCMTGRSYRFLE